MMKKILGYRMDKIYLCGIFFYGIIYYSNKYKKVE